MIATLPPDGLLSAEVAVQVVVVPLGKVMLIGRFKVLGASKETVVWPEADEVVAVTVAVCPDPTHSGAVYNPELELMPVFGSMLELIVGLTDQVTVKPPVPEAENVCWVSVSPGQ